MKPAVLLLVGVALLATTTAGAQDLEVSVLGGYRFGGTLETSDADLVVEDAPSFTVTAGIQVRRDAQVELFYSRQSADLFVEGGSSGDEPDIPKLGVEYWHIGGLYELRPPGGIRPFVVVRLGATRFDPIDVDAESVWRFSGGFGAGVRVFFSESVGFRIEAQLASTAARSGDYFKYEGTYYSIESTGVHQGSISAGLTVAFW